MSTSDTQEVAAALWRTVHFGQLPPWGNIETSSPETALLCQRYLPDQINLNVFREITVFLGCWSMDLEFSEHDMPFWVLIALESPEEGLMPSIYIVVAFWLKYIES